MYYGKNRFINIPARGHTNPALVKELVQRGETVYLRLLQRVQKRYRSHRSGVPQL